MAALTPHWEVITPVMREMLRFIGQCPFVRRFYLAGGTGLALRLGHRRSVDLDFATDEVALQSRQEIVRAFVPLEPQVLRHGWQPVAGSWRLPCGILLLWLLALSPC